MCNKDIKFYPRTHEFLTYNILFLTIIHKNPLKTGVSIRNIHTFTISVGRVWIVIGNFLFEKQPFNGLLKVIVIQKRSNPQKTCSQYSLAFKISKFALSKLTL